MQPRWNRVINSSGVQPRPRHGHRAVAIKELIVIFGGGNEGILSDLIVYNTLKNDWFTPTVKGDIPSGRAAFGFVVDKTRIIMFGGMLEYTECTCDMYELQASRWEWKQLSPKPPADMKPPPLPRLGHSFTLIGNKIYLFGGLALDSDNVEQSTTIYPRYLNDLYVLDCSKEFMSWNIPVTYGKPPSPRESHSAVAYKDPQGNQHLIVYGGMSGCRLGDLWIFNINSMTWFEVESSSLTPLGRSLHSATLVGDKMFVFGGWVPVVQNENRVPYEEREWKVTNQLACFDLSTMLWKDLTNCLPNDMPKARAGHSAVVVDHRIYIWSGRDGYRRSWKTQICCDDLWYLDIEKPPAMTRPQLLKGELRSLEIQWTPTTSTDCYILQIQKFDINPSACSMEKNSLNLCTTKPCETNDKILADCSDIGPPNKTSSDSHPPPALKVEKNFVSELHPLVKIPAPLPVIPLFSPKPPTLIQKLPSEALPTFNKSAYGFTLAVSKPNFPNQIRSIRPLAMSVLKVNSANGGSELGQKFTLSKPTNLVRLSSPMSQNMKSPGFVFTNPGLKLLAVNKDSQIKLVPSTKSHVVNKNAIGAPERLVKHPPLLKENFTNIFPAPAKKSKASPSIVFSESDILQSHQITKNPHPSELGSSSSSSGLKRTVLSEPESNTRVPLKIPSYPERVQIKKCKITEGIYLSWTPPSGDMVTSYKVALVVKENISHVGQKIIYTGVNPECFIMKSLLDTAYVDETGGTRAVKFTISAKNNKGFGPALVVKWVLHPSR